MRSNISMDIDVQGEDVERMLMAVNSVISPLGMMGFMRSVATPYVKKRAEGRFASEGDDVSGKWAPLQPATREIRANQNFGPDHPINHRTGELERYVTQSDSDVFAYGTVNTQMTYPGRGPFSLALSQKMETAQAGRRNPSTVPRPVLGLNVQDLAYIIGGIGVAIKTAAGYR